MPQFHLNTPSRRVHPFYGLSDFAKGYVEAMFFTNGDTGEERESLLNDLGVERLTRAAVADIARDCAAFLAHEVAPGVTVESLLDLARDGYDIECAGNDFWFTRQGHGVGFWERDALKVDIWSNDSDPATPWCVLPDDDNADGYTLQGTLRDILSDAARDMGEVYPHVARGWIYHG